MVVLTLEVSEHGPVEGCDEERYRDGGIEECPVHLHQGCWTRI